MAVEVGGHGLERRSIPGSDRGSTRHHLTWLIEPSTGGVAKKTTRGHRLQGPPQALCAGSARDARLKRNHTRPSRSDTSSPGPSRSFSCFRPPSVRCCYWP
jgi:hypothetical protein